MDVEGERVGGLGVGLLAGEEGVEGGLEGGGLGREEGENGGYFLKKEPIFH